LDKYASKGGIGLAIHEAFRDVLIDVLSFRFGLAVLVFGLLLAVLLVDGFSLGHLVIYDAHKQTFIEERNRGFIFEPESGIT
jgi:hypothetical protein